MLERIQRFMTGKGHLLVFLCFVVLCPRLPAQSYKYVRTGNATDAHTHPQFGIAMMGGGSDLDEAFRWLCSKVDGGDFLVVRAAGDDDYNSYIAGLCRVNSVATLVIPDRASALDPEVAHIILNAEAVFIAGGDQARYINFLKGTPVQDALNANISAGTPIGGTSAGLAVLGEFIYGALQDKPDDNDLSSPEVLRDPYFHRVTIVRDFLKLSLLANTLTDSHFVKRDRMGRSLGFLARIAQNGWSTHPREIAIDENSAVLVDADGRARIIGGGSGAYFLSAAKAPEVCRPQWPLTIRDVRVYHAPAGASFELNSWTGAGGESYSLSVVSGEISSTEPGAY